MWHGHLLSRRYIESKPIFRRKEREKEIYAEVVPNGLGIGGYADDYRNPHCSYLHSFK